jgi:microcystin-dependent protein
MSDPFVAEIRIVGFAFPPRGWAFCDGQLLPISQNTALFSLLGTYYGGDGKSTFALPNLQGMTAVSAGQSTGGSQYFLGQSSGEQYVTLLTSEMPAHNHTAVGTTTSANQNSPSTFTWAQAGVARQPIVNYNTDPGTRPTMNFQALSIAGGSLPHNNMPPYLTLNYVIAMQGVFPQRP